MRQKTIFNIKSDLKDIQFLAVHGIENIDFFYSWFLEKRDRNLIFLNSVSTHKGDE